MQLHLIKFLFLVIAGWVNREQRATIEYLQADNQVLRRQLPRRVPVTDRDRMRLAVRAKAVGPRFLAMLESLRVPFSCKSRGVCLSCMGRRMAETAASSSGWTSRCSNEISG